MGKPSQDSIPSIAMPNFNDPMDDLDPKLDELNQQLIGLQAAILDPPTPPELAALADVDIIDWEEVEKRLSDKEKAKIAAQNKEKLSLHDLLVADPRS